jgi:nicotinamide mononucleotide transporter
LPQVQWGGQLASAILSIVSIALLARGNGRGWPLGVLSALLLGWIYASERIWGQTALSGYFLLAQLLGWWRWRRGRQVDLRGEARRLGAGTSLVVVLLWFLGTPVLAWALDQGGGLHTRLDAFATVGSLLGQALMVAGFAESWLVYLGADVVLVALSCQAGLWAYALMYVIYCVLAWQGWRQWTREVCSQGRNDEAQT